MYWVEHVDNYCERTSTGFWSEPLGAVSNVAYFAAALGLWLLLRRRGGVPVSVAFMPPLAALIGVGSFLFHTLATRWSLVADVAPIGLFVFWYFASFLHWFYGLPWRRCLFGLGGFLVGAAAFVAVAGSAIPNRSAPYVPVLALMIGITVALARSGEAERRRYVPDFAVASAVFAVGLTTRTVDEEVCGSVPIGTHFVWHLLTGVLLYVVGRALVGRWRSLSDGSGGRPETTVGVLTGNSVSRRLSTSAHLHDPDEPTVN